MVWKWSRKRLQDHEAQNGSYDLVLSVASINHVDEPACIRLHDDAEARATFIRIFTDLARIMAPGGKVVIIDAMQRNVFGDLGAVLFNPDVEWFKHQRPELWADVLGAVGFTSPRISYLGIGFSATPASPTSREASPTAATVCSGLR